jgi:hypothetical protein
MEPYSDPRNVAEPCDCCWYLQCPPLPPERHCAVTLLGLPGALQDSRAAPITRESGNRSKIGAAPVAFPVAVARRLGPLGTADLSRPCPAGGLRALASLAVGGRGASVIPLRRRWRTGRFRHFAGSPLGAIPDPKLCSAQSTVCRPKTTQASAVMVMRRRRRSLSPGS